jgi:hypothetical protein
MMIAHRAVHGRRLQNQFPRDGGPAKLPPSEAMGRTFMALLMVAYFTVTVLTAGQVMWFMSFPVGASALAASAMCFFGSATFVGSFLARREMKYSWKDLLGIGSIAAILIAAGFALMVWSGFRITFNGVVIEGPYWLLLGIVTALFVTEKKHAL